MLGATCSECCGCQCGDQVAYESQTGIFNSAGRWCCSGVRPSEIVVRMSAVATETSFYSYRNLVGPWFNGQFFDETRGYYGKRYKRTLTLNLSALNVDYVLAAVSLVYPQQPGNLCGYAFGGSGRFGYPRIFPGYEPFGVSINGVSYRIVADDQLFPAYTMTFQTGNSGLGGGTLRREYEYRKMKFQGPFFMVPDGDWIRDPGLDTEASPVDCTYGWAFTGHSVLNAPACDLRGIGLSWSRETTVFNFISDATNASEIEFVNLFLDEPIGGGSMLPQFSLSVAVV